MAAGEAVRREPFPGPGGPPRNGLTVPGRFDSRAVGNSRQVGAPIVTGHVVAGRYRLISALGNGGMGTVWLAEDDLLSRQVAVKEVSPPADMTEHERELLRERTLREARTAARLSHPNVVTIYDVVEDDGQPWIVMELVPSRSLRDVVQRSRPADRAAGRRGRAADPGGLKRRARAGHHAPGRQAGERADRRGRPGDPRRLRDCPDPGQHRAHHIRRARGLTLVHRPRAGPRRARRPGVGSLVARRDALRPGRGAASLRPGRAAPHADGGGQ